MIRHAPALLLFLSLHLLFAPTPATASGWVDDWLTQSTSTPATYFEGQKRGYHSAGSFSARWPSQNDYPVTIQMPKLSGGCGGIDLFGGGISFLNFDYLVDKLQRILNKYKEQGIQFHALRTRQAAARAREDRLEIEESKITPESSFRQDLGAAAWIPTSWSTPSRKSWGSPSRMRRPTSSTRSRTPWTSSSPSWPRSRL